MRENRDVQSEYDSQLLERRNLGAVNKLSADLSVAANSLCYLVIVKLAP